MAAVKKGKKTQPQKAKATKASKATKNVEEKPAKVSSPEVVKTNEKVSGVKPASVKKLLKDHATCEVNRVSEKAVAAARESADHLLETLGRRCVELISADGKKTVTLEYLETAVGGVDYLRDALAVPESDDKVHGGLAVASVVRMFKKGCGEACSDDARITNDTRLAIARLAVAYVTKLSACASCLAHHRGAKVKTISEADVNLAVQLCM